MDRLNLLHLFNILKVLPEVQEEVESQILGSHSFKKSRWLRIWLLWLMLNLTIHSLFSQLLHFGVICLGCKSLRAQFKLTLFPLHLVSNTKRTKMAMADSAWTFWSIMSTSMEAKTCSGWNPHVISISKNINQVDVSQMNTLQYIISYHIISLTTSY